jgi:hypothetical protein
MRSSHAEPLVDEAEGYVHLLTDTLGLHCPDDPEQAEVWKAVHRTHFLFPNLSEKQRKLLHALAVSAARAQTHPTDPQCQKALAQNREAVAANDLMDELTDPQREFLRSQYLGQ